MVPRLSRGLWIPYSLVVDSPRLSPPVVETHPAPPRPPLPADTSPSLPTRGPPGTGPGPLRSAVSTPSKTNRRRTFTRKKRGGGTETPSVLKYLSCGLLKVLVGKCSKNVSRFLNESLEGGKGRPDAHTWRHSLSPRHKRGVTSPAQVGRGRGRGSNTLLGTESKGSRQLDLVLDRPISVTQERFVLLLTVARQFT